MTDDSRIHPVAGLVIDVECRQVVADNKVLDLTPAEFALLRLLVSDCGTTFARRQIIDAAVGADSPSTERAVDVHVHALRRKLGQYQNVIATVRGAGYRCCCDRNGSGP